MKRQDIEFVQNAIAATGEKTAWKCLDPKWARDLQTTLSRAHDAAGEGAGFATTDALEDFLLCLLRITGDRVSADTTISLIDGIFPQAFLVAGGPARTYEVALAYAERLVILRDLSGGLPDDPSEPDYARFTETHRELSARIATICVDDDIRSEVLATLDRLLALAQSGGVSKDDDVEQAMMDYFAGVDAIEASAIPISTTNFLRGRIIFPAVQATCIIPVTWPWQIILGIGILAILGVIYLFSSKKAKLAFAPIRRGVGNTGLSKKKLNKAIDDNAAGLDNDELDEIIDNLKKYKDSLKKDKLTDKKEKRQIRKRIDNAIKRLEGKKTTE